METIIKKDEWERYDLFKHYDDSDNPFIIITIPIDVTNLYHYTKSNNVSFYCTMGYVLNKAVNKIDGFKYRKINDEIVYYDNIRSNYTDMINENLIGYFSIDYSDDFNKYVVDFNQTRNDLFNGKIKNVDTTRYDEVWFSCAPWFNFNSLVTPFNKKVTIPQFIWDRFRFNDNKVEVNLMIMVHHGFIDGFQLNKAIKIIEEEINNFKGDE